MLFRLLAVQFLSTNDNAVRYISVTLMVMETQMGYVFCDTDGNENSDGIHLHNTDGDENSRG